MKNVKLSELEQLPAGVPRLIASWLSLLLPAKQFQLMFEEELETAMNQSSWTMPHVPESWPKMEKVRSLSMSSHAPQLPTGGPLESMAAFMDSDGVLRRSSSVTRRMVLRGASVGKAEYLRVPSSTDDADSTCASVDDVHPDVHEDLSPLSEEAAPKTT